MIAAFSVILLCQLAGEALVRGLVLPLPGPVVGMVIMLGLLAARERWRDQLPASLTGDRLEATGRGILAHLSLLFVPAGVGVVQRLDVFGQWGVALAVALVVSTALALLATVLTFVAVSRLLGGGEDGGAAEGGQA
ncbi:CidA/LrgA family protein [Ferrovibrio sp.]|uniref:CidA/LrgA family protein n=1 Tax=Ferrovibrio sp. TaxID=1917215 RepID=UPI00311DED76